VDAELVITPFLIAFGLGAILGLWAGYALRGPKVDRLQETIAALRETLEKVQGALE